MTYDPAPFYADVAEGPEGGAAVWLRTADNVRIRVAAWTKPKDRGTVLLFPGRTEYGEKYGRTAVAFAKAGLSTLAIDWRGQGLADRLHPDVSAGHVHHFTDYQLDVAAALTYALEANLPRPYYLLAHSMGGCIGLRALLEGLPVDAAAFTGPMWGIQISPAMRPAAWALSWSTDVLGLGHIFAPGTNGESYVSSAPFEDNTLTTSPEMFHYMQRQVASHPELGLGGPSLRWLRQALNETRLLAREPAPNIPCVTFVGTNERIVDVPRIHQRMASWPQGRLHLTQNGEHEVLMEAARIRNWVHDALIAHFLGDAVAMPDTQPRAVPA